MDECGGLENRWGRKALVGSNPTSSATLRLAVVFKDGVSPKELVKVKKSRAVDIVEIRIDQFSRFDTGYVLKEISKFKSFSILATIRSSKEGGKWRLPEERRLSLFREIIPYVDGIDVELSSRKILRPLITAAHRARKTVVVSFHDFKKTPPNAALAQMIRRAKSQGADIVKIAVMPAKMGDLQRLAQLTIEKAHQNVVVLAMGSRGMLSRIFFPALGSLWTYAYWKDSAAPGQFHYLEMRRYMKLFFSAK